MNFTLEIVSPEGKIFSGVVEEVSIPTSNGEITVLPNHADLYSSIAPGEIVVHRGSKKEYIAVLGGFIEIENGTVTVLSDYALESTKVSAAKAQAAKDRAEKLLAEKSSEQDFAQIERELQKAILELNVAEKARKRQRPN